MNTLLWSCQVILALAFGYSGLCKSIYSEATLVAKKGQTGVAGLPHAFIRIIGIAELLGMVGIIVPWWTQIAPVLTPVSALCFALIMVLALRKHYRLVKETRNKKEWRNIATNSILLVISLLVAWGRL